MDESVVRHLEQQLGTPKLSLAIRIGARLRPQCRGLYFANGGSCALGAAWEATRGATTGMYQSILRWADEFGVSIWIIKEITIRNDAGESRESIADWLEAQGY